MKHLIKGNKWQYLFCTNSKKVKIPVSEIPFDLKPVIEKDREQLEKPKERKSGSTLNLRKQPSKMAEMIKSKLAKTSDEKLTLRNQSNVETTYYDQ